MILTNYSFSHDKKERYDMNADRSTSVKSGVERTKMSNNSNGRNFSFPKKHLALLCLKANRLWKIVMGRTFGIWNLVF